MADFEDVLRAARAGDETAFVTLFRSVQPTLLRYLGTLGGPLAEDAAADTWLAVVKGLDRFSGDEAGWRAWVLSIGHARLRDAQRRAVRQPLPIDAETALAERPGEHDVAGTVESLMATEAALAVIARLPRDQAEAVLLRHVVGLDVPTAAGVLGKRPGTVRVACHRGLRRLADLMAPREPENSSGRGVTQPSDRTVTW